MLKKIDRGRQFLAENHQLFRCPVCQEEVKKSDNGLICKNNHRFDLSKKGTLYFLSAMRLKQNTIKECSFQGVE